MAPGVRGENKPTPGGKTVSGPPKQTFSGRLRRGEGGEAGRRTGTGRGAGKEGGETGTAPARAAAAAAAAPARLSPPSASPARPRGRPAEAARLRDAGGVLGGGW